MDKEQTYKKLAQHYRKALQNVVASIDGDNRRTANAEMIAVDALNSVSPTLVRQIAEDDNGNEPIDDKCP